MMHYAELKVDKRGRVRFAAQDYRFEVNERGACAYWREGGKESRRHIPLEALTPKTLVLLAEAISLIEWRRRPV